MAGEWGALAKAALSSILRWLPGRVLRWWYPIGKCQESLTVEAHGVGPHIFVNADRAPAIVGMKVSLMNGLPFSVKVESLHLEVSLESRGLTNHDHSVKESVLGGGVLQIGISDIHLSDGQAGIVRQHLNECPVLKISGHLSCETVAGDFSKPLQLETRAFIFRGGDNR